VSNSLDNRAPTSATSATAHTPANSPSPGRHENRVLGPNTALQERVCHRVSIASATSVRSRLVFWRVKFGKMSNFDLMIFASPCPVG